jgi:hypothetical protein
MPLPYLTPHASAYFLGGYLLDTCGVWDHGIVALPTVHFYAFLGSERFIDVVPFLSGIQRSLIQHFMKELEGQREVFRLQDQDLAGFTKAAALLQGA